MQAISEVGIATAPAPVRWEVRRLRSLEALRALTPEWEALAARALEPNPFYEPWLMLPALENFHRNGAWAVYVVYAHEDSGRRLAALAPFENRRLHRRLPSGRWALLRYYYCGLCTPLLERELGRQALSALLRALASRGGRYDFELVTATGPVVDALLAAARANETVARPGPLSERALLVPRGSGEAYLHSVFSARKRKELRRLERRLSERGRLEYEALTENTPAARVEGWLDEFLALEAAGWKGRDGTAFACAEPRARFFREICRQAHARGRLELYALRLDGRALAQLCLFASDHGYYAFRTAYDETWSQYSPGLLLCVWHSCRMHERAEVAWVDSCAASTSELDNRIWRDRLVLGGLQLDFPRVAPLLARALRTLRPGLRTDPGLT